MIKRKFPGMKRQAGAAAGLFGQWNLKPLESSTGKSDSPSGMSTRQPEAGFVGAHLTKGMLSAGHAVRILDNLCSQVLGLDRRRPSYLPADVELLFAGVRDGGAVSRASRNIDVIYHLAARAGIPTYPQLRDLSRAIRAKANCERSQAA